MSPTRKCNNHRTQIDFFCGSFVSCVSHAIPSGHCYLLVTCWEKADLLGLVGDFIVSLFCLVFAMSLCASVCMCFVVTCLERADLLALVCGVCCELVTFPLVSRVRCGT